MVTKILLTGVSGVGKSTIIKKMQNRGYIAIDTDDPGWIVKRADGERIWDEGRIYSLLTSLDKDDQLILSGTVINQGNFYSHFDRIVLLTAPTDVIIDRIYSRENNSFGKQPDEIEAILNSIAEVQPLLQKRADVEIDTNKPIEKVISLIESIFD